MWHRIRWGNVGRLCAAIAVLALVVSWPRLAAPPPRLAGDEPVALAPGKPNARPRARRKSPRRPRAGHDGGAAAGRERELAESQARRRMEREPAESQARRRMEREPAESQARRRRVRGGGRRAATGRETGAKRPVLGGGMVDARPVPGADGSSGGGAASGVAPTGAASLSPPPAPADPAAAEFGPER